GLTWCEQSRTTCAYHNPHAVAGWDYPDEVVVAVSSAVSAGVKDSARDLFEGGVGDAKVHPAPFTVPSQHSAAANPTALKLGLGVEGVSASELVDKLKLMAQPSSSSTLAAPLTASVLKEEGHGGKMDEDSDDDASFLPVSEVEKVKPNLTDPVASSSNDVKNTQNEPTNEFDLSEHVPSNAAAPASAPLTATANDAPSTTISADIPFAIPTAPAPAPTITPKPEPRTYNKVRKNAKKSKTPPNLDPILYARFGQNAKNTRMAMTVAAMQSQGASLPDIMIRLLPTHGGGGGAAVGSPGGSSPRKILRSGRCWVWNPETGCKEYYCPVVGCRKGYSTANGLRYHLKFLHSSGKGFPEGWRFGDTGDHDGKRKRGDGEGDEEAGGGGESEEGGGGSASGVHGEEGVQWKAKDQFECFSVGCGKVYGSLNGLRYHMQRCGAGAVAAAQAAAAAPEEEDGDVVVKSGKRKRRVVSRKELDDEEAEESLAFSEVSEDEVLNDDE
ncbi:hypothetical protein HDU98_008150, partial [Podochytrium sp. JEL0797]